MWKEVQIIIWLYFAHVFRRSISINRSTVEVNLKREKFSSITLNSVSLSGRAIARRWAPISHCLGSLGRINRHNLEKYLTATRFTDTQTRKTSQRFSSKCRGDISRVRTHFPAGRNREPFPFLFFSCPKVLQGFLLKNAVDPFDVGTLSRCEDNREDNREDYRK